MEALRLAGVVGCSGHVANSLHSLPGGRIIHPLGSCVVIRDSSTMAATGFLRGHTDRISCIAVSNDGSLIAAGHVAHSGFPADICVFSSSAAASDPPLGRFRLHKNSVAAVSFSADGACLASLGGDGDATLAVWDVANGRPLCGGPSGPEQALCVAFMHHSSTSLLTAGRSTIRTWSVDAAARRAAPVDVRLGGLSRVVTAVVVGADDQFAWGATTTGDVLRVSLASTPDASPHVAARGPASPLAGGVTALCLGGTGEFVVAGTGSGAVVFLNATTLAQLRGITAQALPTAVSSLSPGAAGGGFWVATAAASVYALPKPTAGTPAVAALRMSGHAGCVNDAAFPHGLSAIVATCGREDVCLWDTRTGHELVRAHVAGVDANAVRFTRDGARVVTGWGDGRIRVLGPQSGKLIMSVPDAHRSASTHRAGAKTGVTALACGDDPALVVSGGADGCVRVWRLGVDAAVLVASLKEHKGVVNAVALIRSGAEALSASDDGSCLLWDVARAARTSAMYAQTYFRDLATHPDEEEVLTAGSDRRVVHWAVSSGERLRELAVHDAECNAVAAHPSGSHFATGGADRDVIVWRWVAGTPAACGVGHAAPVTKVRFSPDGALLVSVGEDGAMFFWHTASLPA